MLSALQTRDPWETPCNPQIQSSPHSSPQISGGESWKHNAGSHTTNCSRNDYTVSHGKLICECWTLLLGNLAMPRPGGGGTPRQSSSPLQPCGGRESFPGALGGQDGESYMVNMSWHTTGAQEKNIYQCHAGFLSSDVAGWFRVIICSVSLTM